MSFLQKALALAEKGFYVFPLEVGTKIPAINDFPNMATRDPEQIKKFWIDPVLDTEKPYNIGVSTTKFNGNQALVVVDVDNKENKKGFEEILRLELEGFEFVETMTQKTPSGGEHLIYRTQKPVVQGVNKLGKGVDIRSHGGYIVAPGSVFDGKEYEVTKFIDPAPCPGWIIEKCGTAISKLDEKPPENIDQQRARTRAIFYLQNIAAISKEGEGGDENAYKVAASVKDFGVSESLALELLLDYWNERCEPPWDAKELERKIRNAYEYGQRPVGAESPEAQFEPVVVTKNYSEKSFLQEMNEDFAFVLDNGDHFILYETIDEKGRPRRMHLADATFKRMFQTKMVQQGKGQARSFADLWLDWPGRREYRGIVFKPEQKANNNYYNSWKGFPVKTTPYAEASVEARQGFDMFKEHIFENICEKNDSHFNWVMGYFAHLVQKPYEKPLTSLVLKGDKGVGKNVVADRILKLLPHECSVVADDIRYLTSNFNGHMEGCLLLVLDEAFWSGDKRADSKLKGLTTGHTILIERKGSEAYPVDNLIRMIIMGNEDWIVPASFDERRYAVFNVGNGRKQDTDFFHDMRVFMDDKGGSEVLMHYLKTFDLSKVDINIIPKTQGLYEQQLESMEPICQFWFECLFEGKIPMSDFEDKWPTDLRIESLQKSVQVYYREKNIKSRTPNAVWVSRKIKKLCDEIDVVRKTIGGSKQRHYIFPSLEVCRNSWDNTFKTKTDWQE